MSDFSAFKNEEEALTRAEVLLKQHNPECDFRTEFEQLVASYKKLFKSSRRLVRMSDRSEERLKEANLRIQSQQEELTKAHQQLALHAENLEDKVRERTKALVAAQGKLEKLVELGIALSAERSHIRFIEMMLRGAKDLAFADGGLLFVLDDEAELRIQLMGIDSIDLHVGGMTGKDIPFYAPIKLRDDQAGRPDYYNLLSHTALTERTVNVANMEQSKDFDFSWLTQLGRTLEFIPQSCLAVPLRPRKGEVIGVLLLINARNRTTGHTIPFSDEITEFVEALASQAAVTMDNKNLLKAQDRLLDSMIKLVAGAIDEKSSYTGGHCERVPEISAELARAACEANYGAFADFTMTDDEWRAFHIAAWLHDCGKVTTPEYVVDKATKLETIYNRIHEIRMRFEVKLRDYTIAFLEARSRPGADEPALQAALERQIAQLHDDFAFIAQCNVGSECMRPEDIDRLKTLAQITWMRHFDDTLGLSHQEQARFLRRTKPQLPAVAHLLEDKPEHVVRRRRPVPAEKYAQFGIRISTPKHLYNHGEIYNLSIACGTLTAEERFKIKEHAIVTIMMLEELPFPKHMARIPEFAGGHHETMIGTGYPRRLKQEDMSLQARILAIADIFEALTAADRPYKKAKTLNEALTIMSVMRNDQQIDQELFDLFLSSGVYRIYAERYLLPSQIEGVDISHYLSQ
ncbi:HD domain-containing phosphohydrolase [Rhabdochromatium marinum]|uniref:HD domain-containing phosphohydrolase n=1 Tax=Rhabdochromatium marinum TaxID=48729 RepID=UPI001904AFC7|nr:HD domain-containing phosphohydrolase [Rhabdochromatium marinum]MBK1648756.1 diguanylate cyclase [Rhabdochromatium marinum]